MNVRFSRSAIRDARAARDAYAHVAPETIDGFRRRLRSAVATLADFPAMGRLAGDGSRRLVLLPYPYVLVYYVSDDTIEVVAVVHSKHDS